MSRRAGTGNNGKLQATILKKCDRTYHRPQTNRQCASGSCQHTCEPTQTERCRHAWTVRYTVNGVQRDKSFRDEMDTAKRVLWGTGLKKAQDFQLELTRGKRAQGKTYVDPKAGNQLFGPAAEAFIASSALDAGADTRAGYMSCYRTNIKERFARRTLAQMAGQAAADEVTELLNVTMAGKSIGQRRLARMIITGTMDAAVKADKIGRHKLAGINLTQSATAARAPDDDDDECGTGFTFIADDQVAMLADGLTIDDASGRERTLTGVGVAAWLQRTMGLRIREALGAEKADFRTRKNGERYLRLRSQASRDGRGRMPLKHRAEGEGRNVPVPDYLWDMVQAMPDGPLCPGPRGSRYLAYNNGVGAVPGHHRRAEHRRVYQP